MHRIVIFLWRCVKTRTSAESSDVVRMLLWLDDFLITFVPAENPPQRRSLDSNCSPGFQSGDMEYKGDAQDNDFFMEVREDTHLSGKFRLITDVIVA